ncbi:MAG: aldehyde dehydrogenase family protein [Saprospiraceae bacterium]
MKFEILQSLQLSELNPGSWSGNTAYKPLDYIKSFSPVDGEHIGNVGLTSAKDFRNILKKADEASKLWRNVPAPKRGEFVRQIGDELRKNKENLGRLVSYEMGKSLQEGFGEVQEMIDICDFAVGMSRQLYGLTMHSERPEHRMYEQWHPLGIVGIISAFNFPVAVWAWNSALSWICGNTVIWKPSEKTPLCSIAVQKIVATVLKKNNLPDGLCNVVNGNYQVGEWITKEKKVSLVSATGSTKMGKIVGSILAQRFGKCILELGGNNAIIITPSCNLKKVLPAIVFGAVGTAGQRCTSTRRLIIHKSIYTLVKTTLTKAYKQLRIGNPLDEKNHVGPLIDTQAVKHYLEAIEKIKKQGGKMAIDGKVLIGKDYQSACYVRPCIAEVSPEMQIVQHETFAPILYLMKYETLEEAIAIQNDVPQGLSSAIMTENLRESELYLSVNGSDCGIANVNIGTSGAEIGGAFGGEKETGGGRESGSDAWKLYMRRQTNTISYNQTLSLAQGIKFEF